MRQQTQKGFTLVELAISLTIIGLLIGGILKGRQMMENARVAAAISQVAAVKAGMTTFIGTYNGLPGDLKNAGTRIPNCSICTVAAGNPWIGNGFVGLPDWNLTVAQGRTRLLDPPDSEENETILFWTELDHAGLFSGISYSANDIVPSGSGKFGIHAPEARIGGGWIVGQADGSISPLRQQPLAVAYSDTSLLPRGLFIILTPSLTEDLNTAQGTQVLTPLSAAMMDNKIDDGKALTGGVVAYGFNSSGTTSGCFRNLASRPAPPMSYNETVDSQDCGLFVQINN